MGRARKLPQETRWFKYHNENPKGRHTGDCVIRALALALQKPWADVIDDLVVEAKDSGYSVASKENYEGYLTKKLGWTRHKQPRTESNTKYTGMDFVEYLEAHEDEFYLVDTVIAHIGSHHVTVFKREDESWRCYDIWNPTHFCVGNFYTHKGW